MGLIESLSGLKCKRCDAKINDRFKSAVRSKLTDKIYYPDISNSCHKLPALLILARAEGMEGLSDNRETLCLECAKQLEEEKNPSTPNLIKCPDCHKPISKRAATCIHCGCPIGEIALIQPEKLQPVSVDTNIPKCPTCQSTDVEKISLKSKVGKVALVGVFAIGKVSKTFKCNACGYQW